MEEKIRLGKRPFNLSYRQIPIEILYSHITKYGRNIQYDNDLTIFTIQLHVAIKQE